MSFDNQTRREFIKRLALGSAALSLSGGWSCREAKPRRPNILVFFTDDQRFDTIHALGNPNIITPNLDYLVENGTAFTNAYIMGSYSGAVCMPSRAMLLTGKNLFQLTDNGWTIPPEQTMLPELFRRAGYRTFGTGKWHNEKSAFARCFSSGDEIFFGGMTDHWNVPVYHFDPSGKYEATTPVVRKFRLSNQVDYDNYDHLTAGKHSSELFGEAASRFLREYKQTAPFFLYISFTAPHDPRTMPQEYRDLYPPEDMPLPENFLPQHPFDNGELKVRDEQLASFPRSEDEVQRHLAEYYATITHLDTQIGQVLASLKKSGQEENTIIVFTADNGLAVGQHGLMGKQSVYEHSVHVPLILCGPGIPKNKKRVGLCYLNDIFPTLSDMAGLESPIDIEGRSLLKALRDPRHTHREALLLSYKNQQRALRTNRWKLILYDVDGKRTTQLFDLKNDPWEKINLAEDPSQKNRLSELTRHLKDLAKKAGDPSDLASSQ
jgi:arylsulfatase A-like enzyme